MANSTFSTLPIRILVAAIAIPAILWVTILGGYYFFLFVATISALSLHEFYKLQEAKGSYPLKSLGLIAGFLVNGAFIYERFHLEFFRFFAEYGIELSLFSPLQFLLVILLLTFLLSLVIELFRQKGSPDLNLGSTFLGLMIISLFFGTLIGLRELFPYGFPLYKFEGIITAGMDKQELIHWWGGATVISVFATIWVCDTAGYFAGSWFGKHKLFERVSPKKTWEGAIAGFFFAIGTMIAAKLLVLPYLPLNHAIVIGVLIGIFGQFGDLVESRFKRDVGVKDTSSIIPGHGGVYDRFDSLVFVAPIVYLYIDFVVLS